MKSPEERISDIKERCVALIKNATASKEIRQEDIAKDLGIGDSAIRQYSSGRTAVPLQHVEEFCEYMGVSVEYLITGKNNNPVLEAYYSLDDDEKRIADKFLGIAREPTLKKRVQREYGAKGGLRGGDKSPAHGKRHS